MSREEHLEINKKNSRKVVFSEMVYFKIMKFDYKTSYLYTFFKIKIIEFHYF